MDKIVAMRRAIKAMNQNAGLQIRICSVRLLLLLLLLLAPPLSSSSSTLRSPSPTPPATTHPPTTRKVAKSRPKCRTSATHWGRRHGEARPGFQPTLALYPSATARKPHGSSSRGCRRDGRRFETGPGQGQTEDLTRKQRRSASKAVSKFMKKISISPKAANRDAANRQDSPARAGARKSGAPSA